MGQGGWVQDPTILIPLRKGAPPGVGVGVINSPWGAHGHNIKQRSEKEGQIGSSDKAYKFSGFHTGRAVGERGRTVTFCSSGPLLQAGPPLSGGQDHMQRVPLLSLLAGVSAPEQGWTKNSTHNTWR